MLSLSNIKSNGWARKTSKRLWRGNASGKWTYCGRWMNGQNCRAGGWVPDWFEGGQTPLFRRMPKLKGFSNARYKKHYNIINLAEVTLLTSKGIVNIDKEALLENGIISKKSLPIKLLGNGKLDSKVKVVVKVDKASESAVKAIEKAWGELSVSEK